MEPERLAQLQALLFTLYPTEWHAGYGGRTLWSGAVPDQRIGRMESVLLTELVVLLHDYAWSTLAKPE